MLTIEIEPTPISDGHKAERLRQFLLHIQEPIHQSHFWHKAAEFGLTQAQAKAVVDGLIENGDMFNLPTKPAQTDMQGRFTWVGGHKFYTHPPEIDQGVSTLLLSGIGHEDFETGWMSAFLRKGDVVLDIGANIGHHTLICAKEVGPEGKVIAFEPEQGNFALLQKNMAVNGYKNVELVKAAVGCITGELELYLNPRNQGDHRTWGRDLGRSAVWVPLVHLDNCLASVPVVNLIKIDIQGGEYPALLGARELIKRQERLVLFMELWPMGLHYAGTDLAALEKLLEEYGFRTYHIDEEGRKLVDVNGKLDSILKPGTSDFTNLLCLKG